MRGPSEVIDAARSSEVIDPAADGPRLSSITQVGYDSHRVEGGRGSHKVSLTFKDRSLELEFSRKLDDQNVWPATLLFATAFMLYLVYDLTVASFWQITGPDQQGLRAALLWSAVVGTLSAALPIALLRLRLCSCESSTLLPAMVMSCSFFTNNAHFMAQFFSVPGDYVLEFHHQGPTLLLSLVLVSTLVQEALNLRSSRSWILPATQILVLGFFYFCWAPLPVSTTFFLCFEYAAASYVSWRNRRRDERRARSDYFENRELRLAIERERAVRESQQQRLQEVEDRLVAMDAWAGRPVSGMAMPAVGAGAGQAQAPAQSKEDLTMPWPPRCYEPAFGAQIVPLGEFIASSTGPAMPNRSLHLAMTERRADGARVSKIAQRITASDYSIKEFFEDVVAAFPELGLFFTAPSGSSAPDNAITPMSTQAQIAQRANGELEYQRTICAFFSVYWLLRLDTDGKQGFCWGVTGDGEVRERPQRSSAKADTGAIAPDWAKRQEFLESADWIKMQDIVSLSMRGTDGHLRTERVEAMLCLTAIHDVLKMDWLSPQVAEAHGPYKGYQAGAVIHDHDIALAYVMEHYPELLPSFGLLHPSMRRLLLFTQSKMQFNHGWFVQAEAPPGLMLGPLKACLTTVEPGDLPFYFFHWLTDLSGAEGTPKAGAAKLVLKFPEPVLASFLWSIPYLEHLAGKTETQVMEQYLTARWQISFPDIIVPSGCSSIAMLRFTVMAQGEAGSVMEAFQRLPPLAKELLSEEFARTGCQAQTFESCPKYGGPAFLIYYGPALLQRCCGVDEMEMALQILAATCAAGRCLWPLSLGSQGSTVLLDVGSLRTHDVKDIMGTASASHKSIWVMLPNNEREASLELLSPGRINELNQSGTQYNLLDFDLRGTFKGCVAC